MAKKPPEKKRKNLVAKAHLKQGHVQGTKFKTPWQQLAAKLKVQSCSAQDLQRSFEVLQELRLEDVAKLRAPGQQRGGSSMLDCRRAFFVQGRKSVSWHAKRTQSSYYCSTNCKLAGPVQPEHEHAQLPFR